MTISKEHFVTNILSRFKKNFAPTMAAEIKKQFLEEALVQVLRDVIFFDPKKLEFKREKYDYLRSKKKTERDQIAFRSAYLFETLYFEERSIIFLLQNDFVHLMTAIPNESVKRHFGKILADLLKNNLLKFSENDYDLLAQTVAGWAVAPKVRVAVQIWAFEILLLLRQKANIDKETIKYLLEIFAQDNSPAMKSRFKKWRIWLNIFFSVGKKEFAKTKKTFSLFNKK